MKTHLETQPENSETRRRKWQLPQRRLTAGDQERAWHWLFNQHTLDWPEPALKTRKKVKLLSRVRLFATPWTVAYQAPPFMGFSRQEYLSGLPFPSPGDLPNPGIEPGSPSLPAELLSKLWVNCCLNYRSHACMQRPFTHVQFFATPQTVASKALLSVEFSRQEYWSGLSFPPPGDLPDPGIKPVSHISCTGRRILYPITTWEALPQIRLNKDASECGLTQKL